MEEHVYVVIMDSGVMNEALPCVVAVDREAAYAIADSRMRSGGYRGGSNDYHRFHCYTVEEVLADGLNVRDDIRELSRKIQSRNTL